jgi:hypothetical protein
MREAEHFGSAESMLQDVAALKQDKVAIDLIFYVTTISPSTMTEVANERGIGIEMKEMDTASYPPHQMA